MFDVALVARGVCMGAVIESEVWTRVCLKAGTRVGVDGEPVTETVCKIDIDAWGGGS